MPKLGTTSKTAVTEPLTFKVAPHIVEDLGLNLYTTLARVLVEFVANAYDADSRYVDLQFDAEKIKKARDVLKKQYELEKTKATDPAAVEPLETRVLPPDIKIVIEDRGHGMSRDDLNKKFLFAGRRRRRAEPESKGHSPGGRPLMGRKGLGKLAGFGVGKVIEVLSRKAKEPHATKIVLNYDHILAQANTDQIKIDDDPVPGGGGLSPSGTRIILSHLLYDPLRSRESTIESEISEYFSLIDPSDFAIRMNGSPVPPLKREYSYAWPDPEKLTIADFVEKSLPREGGGTITFRYRIRFTKPNQALDAEKRGIRVYAHKRLASTPSLLDADTNMHGFRMTDYLDGIVHADFIDEEPADYIATDRGSLRWESPLLSGMHDFLSSEIKEACKQYQGVRDTSASAMVKEDSFTQSEIAKYDFSSKDKKLANSIATLLARFCKRDVSDPIYQTLLPQFMKGIGHGGILTAISALASHSLPNVDQLTHELLRLSRDELDQFVGAIKVRLNGIAALKKIVRHRDFKAKRNERTIQRIFEACPWLVDPTYTQFLLAADASLDTVFKLLSEELKIGEFAPAGDEGEPDLVFLLCNDVLRKIVIVELKASNIDLESSHLDQLLDYMQTAKEWLEEKEISGFAIHGHLIGTKASPRKKSRGAKALRSRIEDAGPDTRWKARDYLKVLEDTEAAHRDLLAIQEKLEVKTDSGSK